MPAKLRLDCIAQHILLRLAEPPSKLVELLDPLVLKVQGYLPTLCSYSHASNINFRPLARPARPSSVSRNPRH
jgi:hypothetical protein